MATPTYQMIDPPTRGNPKPRYFKPLVRVNGIVGDAGINYKIDPCFLPPAVAAGAYRELAGAATLTEVDDTVVSTNAGAVTYTLPAPTSLIAGKVFVVINHGTAAVTLSVAVRTAAAATTTTIAAGATLTFINSGAEYRAIS